MKEKVLRPIVDRWLEKMGYFVAHENMICGFVDITACKWKKRTDYRIPTMKRIITVELKINDIKGVLRQAKNNALYVDYSYCAMPIEKCNSMRRKTLKRFRRKGVGLLGVDTTKKKVRIIVSAIKTNVRYSPLICKRLWNYKLRMKRKK